MKGAWGDELGITVTEPGGARLLRLTGEFDLAGIDLFQRHLDAEHAPPTKITIVDMRELRFIDSSGVRALLTADRRIRARGGRLIVVKRHGQVEEVLKLTGLVDRLELVDGIPPELRLDDRD